RAYSNSYVELSDSNNRDDITLSKEHWNIELQANDSIITDLFQGQVKNSFTCNFCKKDNKKFVPYQILSLPIPKFNALFIECVIIFHNPIKTNIKYKIEVNSKMQIIDLLKY